jgi:endonuclease/exonuclease/phosphatase family metal-dependent hydrolase
MNKKRLALFLVLLALVFSPASGENGVSGSAQTIKIMSFNIQTFGVTKISRPEVVEILVGLVSQADIIAVQEVRSVRIDPVQRFMDLLPQKYGYVIGPREGRSSSKEQYWVIYDTEKFTVLEQDSWPDAEDIFERSPFSVYFKTSGAFDFTLIDNHIRPSDAENEIRALPAVVTYYIDLWNDPDVLVMGDFNADGRYFDKTLLNSIFPEDEYQIIFTDEDTTVATSHNTYDRFIITSSASNYFTGNFGVIRFDEVYDFGGYSIRPSQVSDHYPIWAEFYIDGRPDN